MHPLATLITDAVDRRFPPVDGGWERVPPWRTGVEAVIAFTGHAVLAVGADVSDTRLDALGVDGYGGAHHPRVLLELAGAEGWIDSLDLLMIARGTGTGGLVERLDLADHPRVQFADALRDEVRVLGRADQAGRSVATVSRGIGGLIELSAELDERERGTGAGADFVREVLGAVPAGEVAVAAVAPGNAASVRAFLAAGCTVLGSVQLYRPTR